MTKYIEISLLRELLRYSPETGELWWNFRDRKHFSTDKAFATWNGKHANNEAFTSTTVAGYKQGKIFSKPHVAHRVVWALHHGEWPKDQVDHINGDRSDNRVVNLRAALNKENARNRGPQSNNTSGYKGVHFYKSRGNWTASICVDGNKKKLGYFNSPEEASLAYMEASLALHKEFARI